MGKKNPIVDFMPWGMCGLEDHRVRLAINTAVAGAIILYVGSVIEKDLKANTVHAIPLVPGGAPGQFEKPQCAKVYVRDPINGAEVARILSVEKSAHDGGLRICVVRIKRD